MSELGPLLPPSQPLKPGVALVDTKPLTIKISIITAALLTLTVALTGMVDEYYLSAPLNEQSVAKTMAKAQEPPTFRAEKGDCYYKVPNVRTDFKVSFMPKPKEGYITSKFISLIDFSGKEPEKFLAGSVPSYDTAACKALKNPLTMEQVKAAKAEARQKIHNNILASDLYKNNVGREGIISILADLEVK